MVESYGMNFNAALTQDKDGNVSLGVHVTDSDGLDIDKNESGSDIPKVIENLCSGLIKDLTVVSNGRKAKKEKEDAEKRRAAKAEKQKKIADLKAQAEALQKEIAALESEKTSSTPKTTVSALDSLSKDFESLLDDSTMKIFRKMLF